MTASADANKRLLRQLDAVANETRLALLELLLVAAEPMTVSDLVARVNVEQPAVTKSLQQLCEAGLLVRERRGRHIYYSIVRQEFKRLGGYLQRFSIERPPARLAQGGVQGTRGKRTLRQEPSGTMPAISLGAGVQSTTLMLMALHGEFGETPQHAIFADTGWEPKAVYTHVEWLERLIVEQFDGRMTLHRVSRSNIRADALAFASGESRRWPNAPLFVKGQEGSRGILRRQCTSDYKIVPIQRRMRELMKREGRAHVELWMGISLDEATRMKPSRVPWATNTYPLIERRMTRWDCLRWLEAHGYPQPPKSACTGCPYHNDAMWRTIRDDDPEAWQDAVEFDRSIRQLPGIRGQLFLHSARVPLDQVDLTGSRSKLSRDSSMGVESSFDAECEGLCGV
ncbi:MAG: metalloregulator ArsR/SmtB family transcription factor [Chloroflexota bacterium]